MAGRKPKPTAVKKLEGNPGKRKLNTKEPNPGKGMPDCPTWLLPEAKTEWIRLSEKLNQMGVLTEIDRSAFAAYCQSYVCLLLPLCGDQHVCYTLVTRIRELFIDMIVAEVLCQHLLYGGSVIVSVDYDKLEGCSDNIDDIVDEPSGFVALHAVYVSSDTDFL